MVLQTPVRTDDAQLPGYGELAANVGGERDLNKVLIFRRNILVAGIGLLAVAQGLALNAIRSEPLSTEMLRTECESPACVVPGSEPTLSPSTSTETTLPPTTTTSTPSPSVPLQPVSSAPVSVQEQAVTAESLTTPSRNVWLQPGENPREFAARYLSIIPSLEQLAARFGGKFSDWQEQLAFIDQLGAQVTVTPEDFRAFSPDRSRVNAFNRQPGHHEIIQPQMYIYHWTGKRFEAGVDQLINALSNKGLRVANYADRSAYSYRLFESYRRRGAHAGSKGNVLNYFSQGGEYETETWGSEYGHPQSPIYDFTPALVKQMVIDGVEFCRNPEVNLPVDEISLISHYAADLLFDSDKYNPETGETWGVDKWDPPQELITRLILPKAKELDAALGPRT